jgi:hypothetical protein
LDQSEFPFIDNPPRPATMLLQIDCDKRDKLKPGMRVRFVNYTIVGDEAGTYTGVKNLEILAVPTESSSLESAEAHGGCACVPSHYAVGEEPRKRLLRGTLVRWRCPEQRRGQRCCAQ